jgi:hypothetical protein
MERVGLGHNRAQGTSARRVPNDRSCSVTWLAKKTLPVIIAAIAREMAAFLWAIGRQVTPAAVT